MKTTIFVKEILRQFPYLITLDVLLLLVVGLLDALSILSLAPVVDLLIKPDLKNISSITMKIIEVMKHLGIGATLWKMLFIFLMFNLIRSVVNTVSTYFILRTKYAVNRNIMLGTFEDFFKAKWHFFCDHKQGTILNTFLREMAMIADAFWAMAVFFSKIIECIFYLGVPFFVSWQVTSISIITAVLFTIPFALLGNVSYSYGVLNTSTANRIGAVIQESLSSAKIILGFGNQRQTQALLANAFDAHINVTLKSQTLSNAVPQLYQSFGILVLIVAVLSGQHFKVPISELLIILYSYLRVIPLIGSITAHRNSLNNFFPSYEQVMYLRQNARQLKQKTGAKIFSDLNNEIAIEGLFFAYPDHKPILENINVRIPKGKMVAFVGESGAGKSTLIDVIIGFNEPTSGRITIDNIPLYDFDIISYRKRIGYVPQDSMLFNMTIRDNLWWAREGATDEEIKEACKQANAAEFIENFPKGYDTFVGDRGVRLSGGQIQRIALARSILRKPALLILDEATSSLDTQSERLIQLSIEDISKKTTVIVIAHRLSTIINADYIYVLDGGKVAEEGTYMQLMQNNGLFSEMVKLQLLEKEAIEAV